MENKLEVSELKFSRDGKELTVLYGDGDARKYDTKSWEVKK